MVTLYHYTSGINAQYILSSRQLIPQEQKYLGQRRIKDNKKAILYFLKFIRAILSPGKALWLSTSENVPLFSNPKKAKGKVLLKINILDSSAQYNIRHPYCLAGCIFNFLSWWKTRITKKVIKIKRITSRKYVSNRLIIELECEFDL